MAEVSRKLAIPRWAWINGRFVPWHECVLHVRCQAVMTGASVFEGIRAYWNTRDKELYVFKLVDHMDRLRQSMKVMRMKSTLTDEVISACVELLAKNEFREDVHIIPVAYVGFGEGFGALTEPLEEGFFMTAVPRPPIKATIDGARVCISSWTRIADVAMPPRVKAAANYQNSRLALMEARINGYDNAILLNTRGTVSEAASACVFIVRNGELITPPVTAGILESITRSTLIRMFREKFNRAVTIREIDRTELYLAEEVFICGSGYEIMPIVSIDGIAVGNGRRGTVTGKIQDYYFAVVRAEERDYAEWRTSVYRPNRITT